MSPLVASSAAFFYCPGGDVNSSSGRGKARRRQVRVGLTWRSAMASSPGFGGVVFAEEARIAIELLFGRVIRLLSLVLRLGKSK
jgi:hypothetical protein